MTNRRRQTIWGAAAGVVIAGTIALVMILGGPPSIIPHKGESTAARTLLWLYAPRDMGRLPARADWCTGATHCWTMQESAGATQLADTVGGWTLDASGTPRAGVATSLPVEDATGWVDFTSELSTHTDGQSASGTGSWKKAAQSQPATDLVSISAVIMPVYRQATARVLYSHRATTTATGFEVGLSTDGTLYATVENSAGTTDTIKTAATWDDGAWHAVTWVLDGRSADAGRIYVDGVAAQQANPDLSTTGSWATTGPATLGGDAADGNRWPGGIARLRVTIGVVDVAATYAGTLWGFDPQADAKVTTADISWTQSGGPKCWLAAASQAVCSAGGRPSHGWASGLGYAWMMEPGRANRIPFGSAVCAATGWTVRSADTTASCHGAVAPDGSKGATSISGLGTYSGRDIYLGFAGFSPSVALYPSAWIKCSSGTVILRAGAGAAGQITIACATINGVWTQVYLGHAAVTQITPFVAGSPGNGVLYVAASAYPTSVDIWGITLTSASGVAIIPTRSIAIPSGDISWIVDNNPSAYYSGSCGKVSLYGSWTSGGCLDVYSPGDGGGRQFFDGAHWSIANSDATPIGVANLVPSGVDTLQFRWNSAAALTPLSTLAEVLRDGAAQTWDTTPLAAWTGESPTAIHLGDYNGTTCRAAVQSVRIWDKP